MSGWVKVFNLDDGWGMGVEHVHEPLALIRFIRNDPNDGPRQRLARLDIDKRMFIDATPVAVSAELRAKLADEARMVQA